MKLISLLSVICLSLLLGGCATITGNSMQPVMVQACDQNNNPVNDVQCKLSNDKGTWFVKAPSTVMVHKSAGVLQVEANKEGYNPAYTTVDSKVGAGMFGNIIFGGVIGAVVDHSKGTAYNYPKAISVTMSEDEKAGKIKRKRS